MIAQEYKKMLGAKSVIREMFTYGTERATGIYGFRSLLDAI